jgi:hypothetical protein
MPFIPYGSLPGESDETHGHISKRVWWLLRKDPQFMKNWNSSHLSRPYHLTVACLTRGLSKDQVLTILRIWHRKHGLTFYEEEFWKKVYLPADEYSERFVMRYHAQRYWDEIRRIQGDPKARQHSKLRVAYYLMNKGTATAREIHEETEIPLKTVRNCLATLQKDGKARAESYGVYRAEEGFYWDRANMVEVPEGRYNLDDEHPAMFVRGVAINEVELGDDGVCRMSCYDYCQDRFGSVLFDKDQSFRDLYSKPGDSEWVIDDHGKVMENGKGVYFLSLLGQFEGHEIVAHVNENNLDFRSSNLTVVGTKSWPKSVDEPMEDYFANLTKGLAA